MIFCVASFIVIPFVVIEEIHMIWLVVIAGICFSWWAYLSKSEGAATFGLPPEDKGSAWESIIWMIAVSVGCFGVALGSTLMILNNLNWYDNIIPLAAFIASIRIIISCVSLGKHGIRFLRN